MNTGRCSVAQRESPLSSSVAQLQISRSKELFLVGLRSTGLALLLYSFPLPASIFQATFHHRCRLISVISGKEWDFHRLYVEVTSCGGIDC